MCDYYEYTIIRKGCRSDPKHVIHRERDIPCYKVTEEGQPMCLLVKRIPWTFGSSREDGPCVKCGETLLVKRSDLC